MRLPAGLGEELLGVTEPEFWEITDRGVNFDYLEPWVAPASSRCTGRQTTGRMPVPLKKGSWAHVPPSANCSSSCQRPAELAGVQEQLDALVQQSIVREAQFDVREHKDYRC